MIRSPRALNTITLWWQNSHRLQQWMDYVSVLYKMHIYQSKGCSPSSPYCKGEMSEMNQVLYCFQNLKIWHDLLGLWQDLFRDCAFFFLNSSLLLKSCAELVGRRFSKVFSVNKTLKHHCHKNVNNANRIVNDHHLKGLADFYKVVCFYFWRN